MKIYISGGITGVENYLDVFKQAQTELESMGYEVINPAEILSQMPQSTLYHQYMTLCIAMIDQSDALYMLKGWEKSRGADLENHYAITIGKEIIYQ